MKPYEQFISKSDIQKIHEASLKILTEIGVKFEDEKALALFKKHGAKIDGNIVYINEELLSSALKTVPSHFDVYVGNDEVYHIGDGTKIRMPAMGYIYISEKGQIRKTTNEDVMKQFKLNDTSKVLNSTFLNYLPDLSGFDLNQRTFYKVAIPLKYGNYKCAMLSPDLFHRSENSSIYEVMKQGIQLLKKFHGVDRAVTICDVNPISPLAYDHDPIQRLFAACEENQPAWFTPCAMPLMTAPPSVASMVAQTNAEVLAGITLLQLIKPGTPALYGNTSASTDMRTIQLSIGAPETALVSYATAGLADLYHIPFRTGGGLSDAKDFDIQAGLESMMMINATEECNPDLVMHSCGTIGSFNVLSLEKFLIDEQIWNYARRLHKGINVTEETLCFEEIKSVGPRGNYLKGRTPKIYREEFILPSYLNKEDPNQWQQKGSTSIYEVAEAEVQKRINTYQTPKITKEQNDILLPYLPERYRENI